MGLEYKIIYVSNMEDGEYLLFWRKIKENNERLYSYMRNSLMSDNTIGIRDDVLKFLSENVAALPKESKSIHDLFTLICNTSISVQCWEVILEWLKANSSEDREAQATEGKTSISDFAIVFCAAINQDIPFHLIKEYFDVKNTDIMTIFEKIGEYDPAIQKMQDEPKVEEAKEPTYEENYSKEIENTENEIKPKEYLPITERVKVEVELSQKNNESNYNEILDHMVNIMSLKNMDIESIYEAQDHVNKIVTEIQLLITELSAYTTGIIREWEKDKNKIVQLNSVLEIQKKLLSEQQIKMNTMRNSNAELDNRLRELEGSLQKSDAIHQKAKELAEMTGSASTDLKINYPYFR